jgi:hypothetical protein
VQTDGRLLELMDHGELSMDASATLASFLERGLKRFPAKRTMLARAATLRASAVLAVPREWKSCRAHPM